MGILVNSFSLEDLMFLVAGVLLGGLICTYLIYQYEAKGRRLEIKESEDMQFDFDSPGFGVIKKYCSTIRADLDKIKESILNDEHLKEEALGAVKFYKWRKWTGLPVKLTETWDEFYDEYQKSKSN